MTVTVLLEPIRLDAPTQLAELISVADEDGAVVNFVGLVRPFTREGERVSAVVLEHHPTLTQRSLEEIALSCAEIFEVQHVRVVHRRGLVRAAEAIVFAGVASPHREGAFEAADYLMDRLKTDAVFWKRELTDRGGTWIEPTDRDFRQRERWLQRQRSRDRTKLGSTADGRRGYGES